MTSTPKSAPHNNSPDDETPDNATPDNATPDDATPDNADGSPPNSPESSSKSPPPPSPPPPDESSPSPPPPSKESPSPPPPPEISEEKSSPPPSGSSKTPSPPPPTQGKSNSPVPASSSSGRFSGSSSSNGQSSGTARTPALGSSSDPGGSGDNGLQKRAIIGGVVGVGTFLIILALVCFICRKKKRKRVYYYGDHALGKENDYYNNAPPGWQGGPPGDHVMRVQNGMGHGGGWGGGPPLMNSADMSSNYSGGQPTLASASPSMNRGLAQGTFTYDELAAATNGFNEANLIGQGGFGYVHKGVLPNGKEVAVKSLKANSGQGEREFQAEIEIISRVHHRHLVSLVGYCITGQQRMLVYEFVPNKTLEHHLHGKGQPTMDWPSRLRIALGSAKGLAYLHEDCHPRIIHRDIKAANVLIDDSFEAKVADFGLAKLTSDTNTHVSTRVMGTFGYLAPEYAQSGKLTEKSDVFSFGVMLLELVTGKRPVDLTNAMEDSLVDWARPLLNRGLDEGNFSELADPFLEGNYNNEEMARMVACAAASIRHSGRKRPKMSQIVRALEGDVQLDDLNEGTKPGHSAMYGGGGDYDTAQYQIDMKKIRMTALSSQDFNSGSSNDSQRY